MGHCGLDEGEKGLVVPANHGDVLRNSASRGEEKREGGQSQLSVINGEACGRVRTAKNFAELAAEIIGLPAGAKDGGFGGVWSEQLAFFQKSRLTFEVPRVGRAHDEGGHLMIRKPPLHTLGNRK